MARRVIVAIVLIAALGLIAWSGYKNYQSRKQLAASQHAPVMVLVPDGQAPPASAPNASADAQAQPLKGKPAPQFTLQDLNGKKVSLADYKGKAVLLNFWATWCGPCKVEIPWLIKLRDQYKDQGFEVLGIESDNYDTDPKAFAEYKAGVVKSATGLAINYPVLLGGDSISQPYGGLDGLPNSFYVDRDGVVTAQLVGLVDRDEIEANIKKALASGAK
jgi:cytochrome c biogenesis protein CcmG/thiol:disulfide interchange protein DsbE